MFRSGNLTKNDICLRKFFGFCRVDTVECLTQFHTFISVDAEHCECPVLVCDCFLDFEQWPGEWPTNPYTRIFTIDHGADQ